MIKHITISLGLLLTSLGFAQENLSLSDAIQLGLENNFQIKIADLATDVAEMNNTYSEAGGGPTISLTVQQNQVFLDNNNPASFINGKLLTASTIPVLNARWVLFNGYRIQVSKQQLEILEAQSNENASIVVENVVQAIILSYYRCLVEQKKLSVVSSLLENSKEQLDLAQEKQELGVLTTFDLLQIENAHLDDSTRFLLSKINYDNSVRNLNLVLGAPVDSQYVFVDSLTKAPEVAPVADIETKMLADNHTLKKEYLNTQLIQNQSKLQKSALYPLVYLDAGVGGNLSVLAPFGSLLTLIQDEQNTTARVGLGRSYQGYVNFTLAWNLFDGNKSQRNVKEAIMNLEATEYKIEDMKRTMSSDLKKSYAVYETQQQISAVSERKKSTSKLNSELSTERWENGILNSFDYRMIQLDYLNSELQLMESFYNQWANYLEISRMTGGILKELEIE